MTHTCMKMPLIVAELCVHQHYHIFPVPVTTLANEMWFQLLHCLSSYEVKNTHLYMSNCLTL